MQTEDLDSLSDLDSILVETHTVKFDGKIYEIPPVTTQRFLEITKGLALLDVAKTNEAMTSEDVVKIYYQIFSAATNGAMSLETVRKMTISQAGAMLNLVIGFMSGKIPGKKKSPMRRPSLPERLKTIFRG